jgi:hypothetical protein
MVTAQGSRGDIILFEDFVGAEIPVASAVAYAGNVTGYKIGRFKVTGDLVETDTGAISVAVSNGALRISGNNENGKGVAIGTEVIFDPALNGMLSMETRVQRAAVTAGAVFAGFCGVHADDVAEPATATGTTYTLTAAATCGFSLDSQLTATATWHCIFNGGTVSGVTDSTAVVTGTTNDRNKNSVAAQVAVAGEWDLLKIDIAPNGTAEWYLNGILVQKQENAVSTSTDLACYVGVWGTASTVASLDIDYLLVKARRNWTR